MKYTIAQWMLIRQAKIPKEFPQMTLLTEFVASEHETVQVFYHRKNNVFSLWVVWDLNGVIVRIAHAVQVVAITSAFITGWEYSPRNLVVMKLMFDELLNGQYGYGSPLLYYWTMLGDRMGAGYHPIAVEEWENNQLIEALGEDPAESNEEAAGMVSWLLEPESKGVPVDITFKGDIKPTEEPEDEEVSEDQFSAFTDFIGSLNLQDIEEDD